MLSPADGQVTHVLLTRSLLFFLGEPKFDKKEAFNLHVLGTPPAFVLSQDQTLIKKFDTVLRLISSMLTLLAYLLACIFASNLIETPYTIGSFAYFVQFSKVYIVVL